MKQLIGFAGLCLGLVTLAGCRGSLKDEPPVHPNPNMDHMHRYDAQESSAYYADGRAMRPRVEGTIPFGQGKTDDHLHRGQVDGEWATAFPIELTDDVLARGQQRYNIYCSPCHDESGSGDGIVVQRGMIPPPSFHDERIRTMPVGELYSAVTDGIRNMPSYASQVNTEDRWAVIAYIRALQLSQNAPLAAVPTDVATANGWGSN